MPSILWPCGEPGTRPEGPGPGWSGRREHRVAGGGGGEDGLEPKGGVGWGGGGGGGGGGGVGEVGGG